MSSVLPFLFFLLQMSFICIVLNFYFFLFFLFLGHFPPHQFFYFPFSCFFSFFLTSSFLFFRIPFMSLSPPFRSSVPFFFPSPLLVVLFFSFFLSTFPPSFFSLCSCPFVSVFFGLCSLVLLIFFLLLSVFSYLAFLVQATFLFSFPLVDLTVFSLLSSLFVDDFPFVRGFNFACVFLFPCLFFPFDLHLFFIACVLPSTLYLS